LLSQAAHACPFSSRLQPEGLPLDADQILQGEASDWLGAGTTDIIIAELN
jgi:hypothetical protein